MAWNSLPGISRADYKGRLNRGRYAGRITYPFTANGRPPDRSLPRPTPRTRRGSQRHRRRHRPSRRSSRAGLLPRVHRPRASHRRLLRRGRQQGGSRWRRPVVSGNRGSRRDTADLRPQQRHPGPRKSRRGPGAAARSRTENPTWIGLPLKPKASQGRKTLASFRNSQCCL